jgi:hypothetical protein
MMPLDPHADPARRAWLPCPNSDHGAVECLECRNGRSCSRHWQYLLSNQGTRVFLQCPDCHQLWDVDTARPDDEGNRLAS